mmetsp:Transcript_10211/g.30136  ORF Transcript_10211/g.30136 Transcript_10211/m.30136 type:complete len:189 (-) Transcript_10211:474-1040(-)
MPVPSQVPYSGVPVTPARGKWAVSLFACCAANPALPVCATCAPCVPLARAAHRARVGPFWLLYICGTACVVTVHYAFNAEHTDPRYGRYATWEQSWRYFGLVCLFVGGCAFWVMATVVRRRLARKYLIREWFIESMLTSLCVPCAVGQQAMHVDLVEYGSVSQDCSCVPDHSRRAEFQRDNTIDMEMI